MPTTDAHWKGKRFPGTDIKFRLAEEAIDLISKYRTALGVKDGDHIAAGPILNERFSHLDNKNWETMSDRTPIRYIHRDTPRKMAPMNDPPPVDRFRHFGQAHDGDTQNDDGTTIPEGDFFSFVNGNQSVDTDKLAEPKDMGSIFNGFQEDKIPGSESTVKINPTSPLGAGSAARMDDYFASMFTGGIPGPPNTKPPNPFGGNVNPGHPFDPDNTFHSPTHGTGVGSPNVSNISFTSPTPAQPRGRSRNGHTMENAFAAMFNNMQNSFSNTFQGANTGWFQNWASNLGMDQSAGTAQSPPAGGRSA